MKILAFSDIHRNVDLARKIVGQSHLADVIIGAGDFGVRGEGSLDTFHVLIDAKCPVIAVHGNHDRLDEMQDFSRDHANIHVLHGSSIEICGVTFFGIGGEVPARSDEHWNATETEEAAASMLAPLQPGAVLVTHTPPFGHADLQRDGSHEGSQSIHDRIASVQPSLALCGHIHNAWGMQGMIGTTPVHNLGPSLHFFELE